MPLFKKKGEGQPQGNNEGQQRSPKSKRCILIGVLCCILILVGIGLGVYFGAFYESESSDKALASDGNVTQNFDPPSGEDCRAIAENRPTPSGGNLTRPGTGYIFDIIMDISLEENTPSSLIVPLSNAIQSQILPALAGCNGRRLLRVVDEEERLLQEGDPNKYVIQDARIVSIVETGERCAASAPQPCKRFRITLEVFLKGRENLDRLTEKIQAAFGAAATHTDEEGDDEDGEGGATDGGASVPKLQLNGPFTGVGVPSIKNTYVPPKRGYGNCSAEDDDCEDDHYDDDEYPTESDD